MNHPTQQPYTRPITEALGTHHVLGQLLARVRQSQARFETIQPTLPRSLRPHVRPGVLDDESWHLMAANAAVAAKLKQCLPLISQVLRDAGWPTLTLKIKIQLPSPTSRR
jgi:hypothetical protein